MLEQFAKKLNSSDLLCALDRKTVLDRNFWDTTSKLRAAFKFDRLSRVRLFCRIFHFTNFTLYSVLVNTVFFSTLHFRFPILLALSASVF